MCSVLEGRMKARGRGARSHDAAWGKPLAYTHQDNLPAGVAGTPGMTAVISNG